MAKASSRKLKVFSTRIGFYDLVVATPSRAAALRAFGVSQDLFAQGLAAEANDPEAVAAALAHPGTPLRRPAGSDAAYKTDPGRPKLADLAVGEEEEAPPEPRPSGRMRKEAPAAPPARTKPRPAPDRRKLAAAEAELATIVEAEEEGLAELRREREALEAEELRLRTRRAALEAEAAAKVRDWAKRRQKAEQAVERERRAYRLAGGKG